MVLRKIHLEQSKQANVPITPLHTGHVALDLDVFPMDNSRTKKEGVSRTYKGHDGYAPLAVYLGEEGWSLGCELREGKQHSQKEFIYTLERILPHARLLTSSALLMRLDSGHDALENRLYLEHEDVDYLIKRIKTVLQELMYLAARVITKSRQCWLRFGKHCAGYDAFGLIYHHLASL